MKGVCFENGFDRRDLNENLIISLFSFPYKLKHHIFLCSWQMLNSFYTAINAEPRLTNFLAFCRTSDESNKEKFARFVDYVHLINFLFSLSYVQCFGSFWFLSIHFIL